MTERMPDDHLEYLRRKCDLLDLSFSDAKQLFAEIDRLRLIESRLNSAPSARKARSKRKESK